MTTPAPAPTAPTQKLPPSLAANLILSSWVQISAEGHAVISPGKVEIGQGIVTALAQIAADELDIDIGRVRMVRATTAGSPNEGVTWTAAPAVILAVLLGFTLQTMGQVKAVASTNVLNVKAIGHQWWWEFRYPDQSIVTAEELVVPVNTNIEVSVESNDVEHGFWVPELFGKVDAVPGYTNRVRFTPITASQYYYGGQCTQFCGLEHAQMRFAVVVRTADDFKNWVAYQQQPAAPAETLTGDAAAGQKLFASLPCVGCHTINGTAAAGVVGPNLTHLASRGFIAGGVLPNSTDSLRAWIKDPQAVKPGNDMPTLGLSDSQVNQLVAYLSTLK